MDLKFPEYDRTDPDVAKNMLQVCKGREAMDEATYGGGAVTHSLKIARWDGSCGFNKEVDLSVRTQRFSLWNRKNDEADKLLPRPKVHYLYLEGDDYTGLSLFFNYFKHSGYSTVVQNSPALDNLESESVYAMQYLIRYVSGLTLYDTAASKPYYIVKHSPFGMALHKLAWDVARDRSKWETPRVVDEVSNMIFEYGWEKLNAHDILVITNSDALEASRYACNHQCYAGVKYFQYLHVILKIFATLADYDILDIAKDSLPAASRRLEKNICEIYPSEVNRNRTMTV